MRICAVSGCDRSDRLARGLCSMHYQRLMKRGSTNYERPSAEERFWAKVNKDGPVPSIRPELGQCWIWHGSVKEHGYGSFNRTQAHRFAYEAIEGAIPPGLELDHLCLVRNCVRPDHLEVVTRRENILRSDNFSG